MISSTTEIVNTTLQNQTQISAEPDDGMSKLWAIQFMVFRVAYLIIIISGTMGNILTFIVMQRGSLKEVSTCFYMSILALVDTGESIQSNSTRTSISLSPLTITKFEAQLSFSRKAYLTHFCQII